MAVFLYGFVRVYMDKPEDAPQPETSQEFLFGLLHILGCLSTPLLVAIKRLYAPGLWWHWCLLPLYLAAVVVAWVVCSLACPCSSAGARRVTEPHAPTLPQQALQSQLPPPRQYRSWDCDCCNVQRLTCSERLAVLIGFLSSFFALIVLAVLLTADVPSSFALAALLACLLPGCAVAASQLKQHLRQDSQYVALALHLRCIHSRRAAFIRVLLRLAAWRASVPRRAQPGPCAPVLIVQARWHLRPAPGERGCLPQCSVVSAHAESALRWPASCGCRLSHSSHSATDLRLATRRCGRTPGSLSMSSASSATAVFSSRTRWVTGRLCSSRKLPFSWSRCVLRSSPHGRSGAGCRARRHWPPRTPTRGRDARSSTPTAAQPPSGLWCGPRRWRKSRRSRLRLQQRPRSEVRQSDVMGVRRVETSWKKRQTWQNQLPPFRNTHTIAQA